MAENVFCSIIVPTIGRSSLNRAIFSILDQELDQADFEVIVVNDSGQPLTDFEWTDSPRVRVLNTNRRERSYARNSGAAVARGKYLAFMDDDDWYLSGAFQEFWRMAGLEPQAVWLYGGIRIVDEKGDCLAEINSGLRGNSFAQVMGGAWAPLQSSLIHAQRFFQSGGFDPAICGTEDEDLCRKLAYLGDFANTPATVACLFRGQNWNTSTNYLRAPEDRRVSRDHVLAEQKSFTRLINSADSSYWSGRICRIYFSLFTWHLKKKRFFAALSRGLYGSAGFFRSGIAILKPAFWNGFQAHHVPNTLHFVMEAYEKQSGVSR